MNGSSGSHGPDDGAARRLDAIGRNRFDVIVIGGGIHGAALAREAAMRGLAVVLLEQDDFGHGASANSLKIIHGGIRYLQRLDISRLRQSVRERRALLRMAPHLVRPLQCIIPAYGYAGKGKLALSVAAGAYDLLSRDRNLGLDPARYLGDSRTIPLEKLRDLAPALDTRGVTGGLSWWDAQVVNSERLVLAFVMSARQHGAVTLNHVRAEAPLVSNGRVYGVTAVDRLSGARAEITSRLVMDCSGAWLATGGDESGGRQHVKAMNLIVRRSLGKCAFGARPDARRYPDDRGLLFHVPWRGGALIGTWYRYSNEPPGELSVNRVEVAEALARFNSLLGTGPLEPADVHAVHLGLLPAAEGDRSAQPTGQFRIVDAGREGLNGLMRVRGVKYTTARDVAIQALDAARRIHDIRFRDGVSEQASLYGGEIDDLDEFRRTRMSRHAQRIGGVTMDRLIDNYGAKIDAIIAIAEHEPELLQPIPGIHASLRAELAYVIKHEFPCTLSDLIFRRTDIGTFSPPPPEAIRFCAEFMASRFGWDDSTLQTEIDDLARQRPLWIGKGGLPAS